MWQEICKNESNTDMKECVVNAFSYLLMIITFLKDVIEVLGYYDCGF
jgi:hypothetical protein